MPQRYSLPSMVLHWTMAVVIAIAWLLGQAMEDMARGPEKLSATGTHAAFGLAVLVLLMARLVARFAGGVPAPMPGPTWQTRLAQATHLLLYGLMLALPLAGLASILFGRFAIPLPGGLAIPALVSNPALHEALEDIHGALGNVLLGAVALHVAATLWHVFRLRDGLAGRMNPFLPAPATPRVAPRD